MALRIEQSKPSDKGEKEEVKGSRPRPDDDEEEEVQGSPNDKVRAKTGQPGVMAAVPLNQIQTPNQVVKLNISHKSQAH